MNALLGGKQGGSGHNSSSSPFGGLANQVLSGLTNSNGGGHGQQQHHGSSGASSGLGGKIVGQLTSNLFSSGNKPSQPQNYHSGQAAQSSHSSGGLAGTMMGGVAHMFGGQSGASVRLLDTSPRYISHRTPMGILTNAQPFHRTKTSGTAIPGKQEPTVAPRLPPHTRRQARPRSTSLPRKDTAPSPTTTPNPRAHRPTTRPNTHRAFPRRRASTRGSTATRPSSNNTRRTASTGKYQARPPARLRRNTASLSTGRGMATRRRPRHTGVTSRVGTTGQRRRTLRLRVSTNRRQGMALRTVACHMGHRITTAAILHTRGTAGYVIRKEAIGLLDEPSGKYLGCRQIDRTGFEGVSFPRASIRSRQGR